MAKKPLLFEIASLDLQTAKGTYAAQLRLRNPLYYLGQAALATGAAAAGGGLTLLPGVVTVLRSAVGALARKPSPAHLAFELVGQAFYEASGRILEEQRRTTVIRPEVLQRLQQQPDTVSLNVTIPYSFFEKALEAPFVRDFHQQLQQWLMDYGQYSESMAQIRTASFKSYFLEALHKLWRNQEERYKPVLGALNTPFAGQLEQVYRRRVYEEGLKALVHESALGDEKLSLKKIYIRPDFHFYKSEDYQQRTEEESAEDFSERKDDLHHYLLQKIIHQNDALEFDGRRLVVLLGQPGQGKTSFCSYFVEEALKEPSCPSLYLIKFRDIANVRSLLQDPFEMLEQFVTKKTKIKAPFEQERLVLVLDGLDELYMSSGLQNDDLKELYQLIKKRLDNRPQWTIVLTSRYHYLQLHELEDKQALILKLAPLTLDQQKDWLAIYNQVHPTTILNADKLTEINKNPNFQHVKELIQQPILLHIVAKSNIDVSNRASRSTLYQQLFYRLIKKNTEQGRGDTFTPLEKQRHRRRYLSWLQEVAYTIYKSDQLYVTQSVIEQLASTKELIQPQQPSIRTAQTPEEACKDLMVSFYFKETAPQEAYAVEFLHKSLQEYMTVAYFLEQLAKRFPSAGNMLKDEDAMWLLKNCSEWFGQRPLTFIIRHLLVEQIGLWNEPQRRAVREGLKGALRFCLERQFLCLSFEKPVSTITAKNPIHQALYTFEGYWWILGHLLPEENRDLLEGVEIRQAFVLLLQWLNSFVEPPLFLHQLDLSGADLSRASLSGADLSRASLNRAVLRGNILRGVVLRGVDLSGADLRGADLRGTNLKGADLIGADLSGADLRKLDLKEVDLIGAKLIGADLSGADLRELDLEEVDLRGADLSRANLRKAVLNKVDFREAVLNRVDLREAVLEEVDFRKMLVNGLSIEIDFLGARVSNSDFFQQLSENHCLGVEELQNRYTINEIFLYEEQDVKKEHPHSSFFISTKTA